jgi:hypothetical protein
MEVSGSGVQVVQSGAGLPVPAPADGDSGPVRDLADVVGQPVARKAAQICAARGHHMLLLGAPGSGNPMPELRSGFLLRPGLQTVTGGDLRTPRFAVSCGVRTCLLHEV